MREDSEAPGWWASQRERGEPVAAQIDEIPALIWEWASAEQSGDWPRRLRRRAVR